MFHLLLLCAACGLLPTAPAAANAATTSAARASGGVPGVRVWLPLEAVQPRAPLAPARSSASYRLESNDCPPGTWRWFQGSYARLVEIDVASALIVRLDVPDASPEDADALATAAERITSACRVLTGVPFDGEHETTLRFPLAAQPVEAVRAAWASEHDFRIAAVARILSEAVDPEQLSRLRLGAIVARERVVADCAMVELCEGGSWKLEGFRARSTRRQPLPPLFFDAAAKPKHDTEPATAELPEPLRLAEELVAWVKEKYVAEAAAAALLADGGDPCLLLGNSF